MTRLKLSPEGAVAVQKDSVLLASATLMASPHGFREFLNYWHFLDQDTGVDRVLGEVLWPAQDQYIAAAEKHGWVFYLKARQLGETTIECAYDGWVARWRDENARVHVFSKRDEEAQELLERIKYGYEQLPEWMKLPVTKNTTHEFRIDATSLDTDESVHKDRRLVKAYPADKNPSRSATCTHAHLDEWAFMGDPRRVWQAVKPSAAGTVHLLTTGEGPQNWTSKFWRRCEAGDEQDRSGSLVYPCFIGALERPDRTMEWLKRERASSGNDTASLWEFPLTPEEALAGGGGYVFRENEIEGAGTDFRGLSDPKPGRKYSKGVDIGRHADAAVIIVLDVTEDVHDVVYYRRLRGMPYPVIQRELEDVHKAYKGPLGVEKNHAGEAVIENLNLPQEEIKAAKFTTSESSKARILSQLKLGLQSELIKWDPEACDQLDAEMRGYQLPDGNVVQDSVIALAIAEEFAPQAWNVGRVGRVSTW
jgi:hypothetical protein